MTDQELASQWDADHRLAAITSLASGALVVLGTALVFTVGIGPVEALIADRTVHPFEVTMVGGLLLIVDVALLVFVVALAHAFTQGRSFGLTVTTAVASGFDPSLLVRLPRRSTVLTLARTTRGLKGFEM